MNTNRLWGGKPTTPASCTNDPSKTSLNSRILSKPMLWSHEIWGILLLGSRQLIHYIPYDYKVEVTNRFKGLDLIDRVPEELWMEVHNIVQEAMIKIKKKKCKKAKRLSDEALQIAEKRRKTKGKKEKERYTHLNAELQRTAKRDEKALLRDQCKEIEENNRMGKTRDLFKKIKDTKGTFHAKWAQ